MADKSSTWVNGSAVIAERPPGMQTHSVVPPATLPTSGVARTMLIVTALSACTALVLIATPVSLAWESLRIIGVAIVLLAILRFRVGRLKPVFLIWWLVLVSESIFFREAAGGDSVAEAFHGRFPVAAYSEVLFWILCLLAALLCSEQVRGYFSRLFAGDYKWVTLFALICLASCVYAPRSLFALAWALKLALVVLVLVECSVQIHDFRNIVYFLRATLWAYAIVVFVPVIIAMLRGEMFDEEGRMSTVVSPNALSPNAGVVLLLALTLFSKRKDEGLHKSAILLGIVACVIMILAGSKTGILAAIFAGTLFYLLRGRFGSAFSYVAAGVILVIVLALSTPLGDYLHAYREGGGADSFSGRTLLWSEVMPAIRQKPILGHGYLASEFAVFQVNAVRWAAPHLHNGFLEALYNNGLIGFVPILAICIIIPRNLYRVLRRTRFTDPVYRISAGCLSLYAFLLINGFFNSSFGGKASAPFMLLLSLVVVSHKLLEVASQTQKDHAESRVTYTLAKERSPNISWSLR
jgi:O-antigen ligase